MMRPLPAPAALLAVLAAALLAFACSPPLGKQPSLERHFYALTAPRPETAAPGAARTVLKVRPFQISPAFQGKDMVYRLSDTRFEADYYNAFFVPPALALGQQTEQWLGRSGVFGHVVDSTSQVMDTHVLEAMISAIYADFRDKDNPKAVLEVQFFLLRNKDERYQVAFSKTYAKQTPFSATFTDASELAKAYNSALASALADLEADLRRAGVDGK